MSMAWVICTFIGLRGVWRYLKKQIKRLQFPRFFYLIIFMMSWGTDKLNFTIMNLKKTVLFAKIATVLWLLVSIFYFVKNAYLLMDYIDIPREGYNIEPEKALFLSNSVFAFITTLALFLLLISFTSISEKDKEISIKAEVGLIGSILIFFSRVGSTFSTYFLFGGNSPSYGLIILEGGVFILSFIMLFSFQKKEEGNKNLLSIGLILGLLWSIVSLIDSMLGLYFNKILYLTILSFVMLMVFILFMVFYIKLLCISKLNLKTNKMKMKKKGIFTIIGGVLGLPLSYYFQSDYIREKVGGIGGYIQHFGDILKEQELLNNVLIAVVVFAVVGFVIGYFVDKADAQKEA